MTGCPPAPESVPAPAPRTVRGMAFMVGGTVCVAITAPLVRIVSEEMHPFQIAFFGNLFGLLIFTPIVLGRGLAPLRTRRFGLLAVRGALSVLDILLIYTAFSLAPLAKVVALDFAAPLFATALALVFLGETIRMRRITALVAGFVGALIIIRPGLIAIDTGTLAALGAAMSWGLAIVVIKVLARTESSVTITLYTILLSAPFNLIVALPVWTTPGWSALALLAVIGGVTTVNHLCAAQAFKDADLTAVLPLNFLKMIWVALAGFLVFGEIPDAWTWVGSVMIFSAATYIAVREGRVRRTGRRHRRRDPRGDHR